MDSIVARLIRAIIVKLKRFSRPPRTAVSSSGFSDVDGDLLGQIREWLQDLADPGVPPIRCEPV